MVENFLFCFVLVVAVAGRIHHPKFLSDVETNTEPVTEKVLCSRQFSQEYDDLVDKSICGEPHDVLEYIQANIAHEQVTPRAVWVKRCEGLCDFDNNGTCSPMAIRKRHVPIRIYNLKTNSEMCATYPVMEHVSCECLPEA